MILQRTLVILTGTLLVTGCSALQQTGAPNDTTTRALNEMKATPRALPPTTDPRDSRIADLERRLSDADSELAKLRGAASNLTDANRRINDLERHLADRDRELAAMRSSAGDASTLASRLSSATGDLDQANRRLGDLERQLAAAQAAADDRNRMASDLAAAQSQLAALQTGASEKDKLAAELEAGKKRIAELEAQLAAMGGAAGDKERLAADLAAAKTRLADLERQLGERNAELAKLRGNLSSDEAELARLRGELSAEMAKLRDAQRGLIKALRPEIDKGNIAVDLNNERLLINLASAYLFGTGEDQLKPAGAEALQRVGGILKDYPEYKVQVDGHSDNRPIRSALKKRFPTNKELSEARAANAVKALTAGGVPGGTISASGYSDTRPVAPNTSEAGRAKNRRVEVRVTPKS